MNRLLAGLFATTLILATTASAQQTYSDEECKGAFLGYMNAKAGQLHLSHTRFADASGYEKGMSSITPNDAVGLILEANCHEEISSTWGKNKYAMRVEGEHARTDTIGWGNRKAFTDYYELLGGKTGTLAGCHNAVFLCQTPEGQRFVAAIINSSWEQRWPDAKKLIDMAVRLSHNPYADISDIQLQATGALVCIYPHEPDYSSHPLQVLYHQEPDTEHYPASVTKVMTAICLLDWVSDLDELIEIKKGDLMPGSGPQFWPGDRISYRDALHALFLPSSNTAAVAIARTIGALILTANNAETNKKAP